MSLGNQSSYKKQTGSSLSLPVNQLPWGFAQTHSPLYCSKDREGGREVRFINTQSVPHSILGALYVEIYFIFTMISSMFMILISSTWPLMTHIFSHLWTPGLYTQEPSWYFSFVSQRHVGLNISQPNTWFSLPHLHCFLLVPYLNSWHYHPPSFVPPSFPNLNPAS